MLTWWALWSSFWQLFCLSCQIVFYRKIVFMVCGIAVYFGGLYLFAMFRPGEGFSMEQALRVLVEIPGTVLGIYLTMDMIAGERDKDTLEILFSTSTNHYKIWSIRLVAICVLLIFTLLGMSISAYFLFAEFPYFWGGLNGFVSAFFLVGVTFLFSVLCQGGNAAGMLSLGVLIMAIIIGENFPNSPYFLFLNPFEGPLSLDENIWLEKVWINRIGYMGLGVLCIFLSMRKMENREKLL